jgi:hypothetical protein
MKKRLLKAAIALLVIGLLMPASASAYIKLIFDPYLNNTYNFRINDASFSTNLRGLSLTTAQARHWVRWSVAQWKGFSGSGLITSEGTTTTLGDTHAECENRQAHNFIGAVDGCETALQCTQQCRINPNCGITGAITHPFQDAAMQTGRLERSQICVFGQAHDWEVDADAIATTEMDLVGVLTHELGHALGLNHTNGTVMQSNSFLFGNTLARVPYGDDIAGMRDIYGQGANSLKVAIYDDNGGFTYVTTPGTFASQRYGATITRNPASGNAFVIHAGPSNGAGNVHFRRTPYPVTAASVWTNRSFAVEAFAPPRMVSTLDKTVAAWPLKTNFHTTCQGIMVGYTKNAFDSISHFVLEDSCTLHPVSLAYDPVRELYIMAYLRHHATDPSKNGRIMFRVSTDAFIWESPIDSTIRSSLAPSIACSDGECVLTYNHRGVDGYPFHREFDIGVVSHNLNLSSTATSFAARNLTPPSAAGRTVSSDVMLMWSNQTETDIRFEPATSVPVTFDDQFWVASTARYGGEIGVFSDTPPSTYRPHIFYVVP